MNRISRLESLEKMAAEQSLETGLPIAAQPTLFLRGTADNYTNQVEFANKILDFAADKHGVDPERLKSMSIELMPERNLQNLGYVSGVPGTTPDNQIVFPHIVVFSKLPNALINAVIRHEIRHVFQVDRLSLYDNPRLVGSVRVGASLAAIGIGTAVGYMDESILSGVTVGAAGTAVSVQAKSLLHLADWQEADAHIFAARTADFRPIKL